MAAASTLPVPKRKKQVYGKQLNRSKWNVDSFFDDDDLPSSDALPTVRQRQTAQEKKPSERSDSDSAVTKLIRPPPKTHDTFDIPSSDDDQVTSPASFIQPPKLHKRTVLVDDTDSSVAKLAPWEKRKVQDAQEKTPKKASSRSTAASPEAQLRQDLMRALSSQDTPKNRSPSSIAKSAPLKDKDMVSQNGIPTNEPGHLSAMARLAARRHDGGLAPAKRPASVVDTTESSRKRSRPSSVSGEGRSSSTLEEPTANIAFEKPRNIVSSEIDEAMDIYDFIESSSDERPRQRPKQSSPKLPLSQMAKRSKPKAHTSRTTVQKGLSVPARLTEIVTENDFTDAPTRSPSAPSRHSTPQQLPSTPPCAASQSPDAPATGTGTLTPKQAQLWHDLLPIDTVAPSPSTLPIKDLAISRKQQSGASAVDQKLAKSHSGLPRRRTRLVDRLKASAPSSNDDISITEEAEEGGKDMDPGESDSIEPEAAQLPERPTVVKRTSSHTQFAQRQVAAITQSGPKITYAQSRSYLQEDSMEQDFMVSLATDPIDNASQSKSYGKSVAASQNSAFDLNDSEDESGGIGKIRTIHELRAAGRNVSGMYDIEELLGEIQNHNSSQRGRRRNALMDLATKLVDKAFAVRFTAQSLEIELAAECGAASDPVADFVLAGAIALVLVSEPPQHTVRSFKDQGVLTWLVQLLDQNVAISTLAASRQNNMSKVAQASLIELSETMEKHPSLWPNGPLTMITARFISLKALDQLISKLRRLGDRSELLSGGEIHDILPTSAAACDSNGQTELDLAISILESLSTSTASLTWPPSILQSLSEMLPRLDPTSVQHQHSVFLMLRLCLNLTNENVENCGLLSKTPEVTHHLLKSITEAFVRLDAADLTDEPARALALDLLVLAMGILINLTEHNDSARQHALKDGDTLSSLIVTFQNGQRHMLEAESVEESVTNVAFGYLAVVLANICRNSDARHFVAERLPGKNLGMLIEAVEEFVTHHSKVDMMNFDGEEGAEVWSAFTEKLKLVLVRLREGET